MLPTIEWKDDAVVMIDQRKLPASRSTSRCRTAQRGGQGDQDDGDSRRAGDWRGGGDGHRARDGRSKATGTKQFATEFQKMCDLMAATRPTAVNLFWAIERMKQAFAAAAQGGGSVDEIKQRLEARGAARSTTRTSQSCRAMGAHGAALVPDDGAHPDALQRRRAGDGRATAPRSA